MRDGKVSTTDLVTEVADELGLPRTEVKRIIDTFFQYTGEYLQEGYEVSFSKVMSFKFAYTPAKKKGTLVMNPTIGEKVPLAEARPEKLSIRARVLPTFARTYAPSPSSKSGKAIAARFKAARAAKAETAKAA